MKPLIKVGCCGFPVSRKRYGKKFSVVEVQKTFYSFPKKELILKWRESFPEDFEFVVKASQFFTHPSSSPTYRRFGRSLTDEEKVSVGFFRLNDVTKRAWDATLDLASTLRADKVLFQAPPSFGPSGENLENLKRFFDYIRGSALVFLLELRGRGWDEGILVDVFRETGAFHVVDPTASSRPVTEGFYYFRVHGGKDYRHRYSEDELRILASYVMTLSGDVYVMFNNVGMFENAAQFFAMVGSR